MMMMMMKIVMMTKIYLNMMYSDVCDDKYIASFDYFFYNLSTTRICAVIYLDDMNWVRIVEKSRSQSASAAIWCGDSNWCLHASDTASLSTRPLTSFFIHLMITIIILINNKIWWKWCDDIIVNESYHR